METLKLSLVVPDVNQPRKLFRADKIASLKQSIQKYGIKQPLIVEKMADGKYFLQDGERRFRAATELGLKEVPVIIEKYQTEFERLVQQFHIQEQHEGWTASEKAMAVATMAKEMDMSAVELAKILGIAERATNRYLSFYKLLDKKTFVKSQINIEWASPINGLNTYVRRIYSNVLNEEFTREDEADLERSIIERISSGQIKVPVELTKLKDSFKKDPKVVRDFIKDVKITPEGLFLKTKAKGAYHLRNAENSAGYIMKHIDALIKIGDVSVDEKTVEILKRTMKMIEKFLTEIE
jgi:ParB/RepB/Spo0J family partition protein